MKKKALYTLLFLIPLFLLGAFSPWPSPKTRLIEAEHNLKEGAYEKCQEKLAALNLKKLPLPCELYEGYVHLLQENRQEADLCFSHVQALTSDRPLVHLESSLARIFCCYQEKRYDEMGRMIATLDDHEGNNRWVAFLKGALAYEQKEYQKAITYWADLEYHFIEEEKLASTWAPWIFKKLFPSEKFELQLARALIEQNDYLLAREWLERLKQTDYSLITQHMASLYLGYSYMKEAEHTLLTTDSFYELASFYFERTSLSYIVESEHETIAKYLASRGEQLIEKGRKTPLICILHSLQRWQATDQLDLLSTSIVNKLVTLELTEEENLIDLLSTHFDGSLFHRMVVDKLAASILKEIPTGELSSFPHKWQLMDRLVVDCQPFQQKCLSLILVHLEKAVLHDDDELPQLQSYLELLDHLGKIEDNRPYLSHKLLEQAKLLWQEPGCEQKATHLMELAYDMAPNKTHVKEEIELFLGLLYDQAEASNLVERLSYVYDALLIFNLRPKSILDPSIQANHLADAQYRFHVRQFLSSKIVSSWVLKLDPHNQEAIRLLGLTHYHLGDYHEAIAVLQKLLVFDQESYKALWLSTTFSKSDQSHLVQIDHLNALQEEDLAK